MLGKTPQRSRYADELGDNFIRTPPAPASFKANFLPTA